MMFKDSINWWGCDFEPVLKFHVMLNEPCFNPKGERMERGWRGWEQCWFSQFNNWISYFYDLAGRNLPVKRIIPAIKRFIFPMGRIIPAIRKFAPAIKGILSASGRFVPAISRIVPAFRRFLPASGIFVPAMGRFILTSRRIVPAKAKKMADASKIICND